MNTLLIDLDNLKIIKAADGKDAVRRLEYWADILIPKKDFYIGGEAKRDFSVFTRMELKMIYNKAAGEAHRSEDYQKLIVAVYEIGQRMEPDDTTIGPLVKKLGKPLSEPSVKPQKEKRAVKPSSAQPTRPRAGTTTARVWEIADELLRGDPGIDFESKAFRQHVIDTCGSETINPSTAATQFAKWKRDHLSA